MLNPIISNGSAETAFLSALRGRAAAVDADVTARVSAIVEDVRLRGDAALLEYTKRFDRAETVALLNKDDFKAAYSRVKSSSPELIAALEEAAENIRAFHKLQLRSGYRLTTPNEGVEGEIIRPLARVGLYVPGGSAAYPSTVLMNAVPAKLAGVGELVMVTPPQNGVANDDILAAAHIGGVDRGILVGGAQAVAALAYGTHSVPRVDKIVGPGNIYVATAKRIVYGICDIDMIAGPSEITIIADGRARADYIAADMLSQAEHDKLASSIALLTDSSLANKVAAELERQLAVLPRREIAEESLRNFGGIIVVPDLDTAVDMANEIAPEHLEILTADPMSLLPRIKNAGSVFLGEFSPEPVGDYFAGSNHVLPTSGSARFSSPLSVDDFIKKMQYVNYAAADLRAASKKIIAIAEREGLHAHANSVRIRGI